MTSTTEVLRSLQSAMTSRIPVVLIDAHALVGAAAGIERSGRAVESALEAVGSQWQRLPGALEAPGTVEPLFSAMDEPARQAIALASSSRAIAGVLMHYAELVVGAKRTFDGLRDRCSALMGEAELELASRQGFSTSYGPLDELPAPASLAAGADAFERSLASAVTAWSGHQREVAQALRDQRDTLDPALLIGPTGRTTAEFSEGNDRYPIDGRTVPAAGATSVPFDGVQLGMVWALGAGHRNLVLGKDSGFARALASSGTVAAARRAARKQLSAGAVAYGDALDVDGRSVGGAGGLLVYAGDALKVGLYTATLGGVDAGVDESFLGSYDLEVVPIAAAGVRRAVVRFTVTNATTAASGTRVPVLGYGERGQQIDALKNHLVEEGPGSELTQTITWTEVLSWPPARRPKAGSR